MTTRQSARLPSAAGDVARLGLIRPPLVYLVSLVVGTLVHLAAPLDGRLVAEHRDELEIRTLLRQPGPHPQARGRVGLRDVARVEMMHAIRRDDEAHAADGVELPTSRP